MTTFHLFPCLPFELRIKIWESVIHESRVVKVRELFSRKAFWSPTSVPAVTRVCQESRKHCRYQKAFAFGQSQRYIWVDFENDIIQMHCTLMGELADGSRQEKKHVQHLRIETWDEIYGSCSEFFYHKYRYKISCLPALQSCDILTVDSLYDAADHFEIYWGACQKDNVRIVDSRTGEYITAETAGPYQDWLDTGHGQHRDYCRIVDYGYELEEEEAEEESRERYEAMMKMAEPLPRIVLD